MMVTDWEAHFDAIARRLFASTPKRVPKILYHYTDAAGLAGMMRGGSLWATDYRFLNDESEREYTRAIAENIVRNRLENSIDALNSKFYNHVIRYHKSDARDDIFLFSLSQERDDLSQWRGYAREGVGFTIGLSGEKLKTAFSPHNFLKMQYDPSKQASSIEKVLDEIEKEMVSAGNDSPEDVEQIVNKAGRHFVWCVEQRATSNKHKSFRAEREWRIVSYVPEKIKRGRTNTRVSGQRLVNYTELSMGGRLPIVAIGIGPGFRGADQYLAIEALCRETGYDVDIYDADTPYRRV